MMSLVRPHPLDAGTILQLQSTRGYPCISLLLPTTPGEQISPDDRVLLENLAAQAQARVRQEAVARGGEALDRLDLAVTAVVDRPVRNALALFVNPDVAEVVDLPVSVEARCVVDPTFATRDLVRALHRTPRHVLLLLAAHEARLFDGALGQLSPAGAPRFPMRAEDTDIDASTFQREVDQALGAYLRIHPAPVVVAADEPTASQFRAQSVNITRLAGVVAGDHLGTPLPELELLVRPMLEKYLHSREAEAMALVETRRGQQRVALGIDACWRASRWQRPEMLAVEEGFFYPARLSEDGDELEPARDPAEPGVVDDVVDELIEAVLTRGGWVALVGDGVVPDGAKVALTLQS